MGDDVEITIRGDAGATVRAAFEEFEFKVAQTGTRTRLRADLPDQAALHGVLERMRDLGIEILEVRISTEGTKP
jgi:hypothetical protein